MDREIPLRGPKTSQEISGHVALAKRNKRVRVERRICEGSRIKRLPPRVLRSKQVKRLSGNQIGSKIDKKTPEKVGKILVRNINGRGGACQNNTLNRPAAQNRVHERVD